MKLMFKIAVSLVSVVLVLGAVMIALNFQSVNRERDNTIKMYEERGVAIAKAIDASVTSEPQLNLYAQSTIDKAIANDIGISEFDIYAKAPAGKWEGYWRIASNIPALIYGPADPEDVKAIKENNYNVVYETWKDIKYIDITSPLHDVSGNIIAAVGIKFDMSAVDKLVVPSSTYIWVVVMIVVALLVAVFLAYSITKPVKQLTEVANKVSTGEMDVKMPDIKSKDEIGDLAKSFGRMVASIKFMMMSDKEG